MPEDRAREDEGDEAPLNNQRIAELYIKGSSINDLSLLTKLSVPRIRSILVSEKVEIRPRGGVLGQTYATRYVGKHARRGEKKRKPL